MMQVIKLKIRGKDYFDVPDKRDVLEKMLHLLGILETSVFGGTAISYTQKMGDISGSVVSMIIHINDAINQTRVNAIIHVLRDIYRHPKICMESCLMELNGEYDEEEELMYNMLELKRNPDLSYLKILTTQHSKWDRFNTLIEGWGPDLQIYVPPPTAKPLIYVHPMELYAAKAAA